MSAETGAILTATNVWRVFSDCLYRDDEDTTGHIVAEGIVRHVGFHPGRIDQHRQCIHDMLAELPDAFKSSGGKGYSFVNAAVDRSGNLWADSHRTMEQLVQLGIAIGEVEYCTPRSTWGAMPAGVPYFVVRQ